MNSGQLLVIAAALIIVGIAAIILIGIPQSSLTPGGGPAGSAGPNALPAVEVRSYQGNDLSSVNDFHENSIRGPQHVDIKTYRLKIGGLVDQPLSLSYSDVTSMPAYQKVTTLNCVEGWSVTYLWTGVKLKDLLERAGYDKSAKVIIFRCYDGYSTSLPASYIVNRNILLAYRMNNVQTPPERGFPFQVIAEDQLGYKWAKWVTEIEVSNDTSFRGYWEQRGYENTAPVPGTQ